MVARIHRPKIYYQNDSSDWRVMCEEIRQLRAHAEENMTIMSNYDKKIFGEQFSKRYDVLLPKIQAGAIAEFDQAAKKLKIADAGLDRAIIAEIASWDAVQLSAEMSAAKLMVDGVLSRGLQSEDVPGMLSKLLDEAKKSGNPHKLRGMAEVLQNMTGQGVDHESFGMNQVGRDAKQALVDLRHTDGIKAAEEKQHTASDGLTESYKGLERAYRALHEKDPVPMMPVDPLEKTMARVHTDRRTGETTVYDSYDDAYKAQSTRWDIEDGK